jgi:hypothetical protein
MIPINDIFDFLIVAGVLTLAVLAAVAADESFDLMSEPGFTLPIGL